MGSSKFEFETYKMKRFKTNKLGEREYIVGFVPYKISPLVCHREDAVRKEHNVFVLIRQQIVRRQHGPPLTAMCRVRESNNDVEHHDEIEIVVPASLCRRVHNCYLLQSHVGIIIRIQAQPVRKADPNG